MVRNTPKMSALVVSAIRNLCEARGSTSKDIMSYIVSKYDAPETAVQRQIATALKRGVEYGILKKVQNNYILNTDPEILTTIRNMVPMDRSRRRRRRGKGRRRRRPGRRSRGRRRGRGRGRRRSRARGRRRGGLRVATRKSRELLGRERQRRNKEETLNSAPTEVSAEDPPNHNDEDNGNRSRNHSKSRDPSPATSSRSSVSSDEGAEDDQPDRYQYTSFMSTSSSVYVLDVLYLLSIFELADTYWLLLKWQCVVAMEEAAALHLRHDSCRRERRSRYSLRGSFNTPTAITPRMRGGSKQVRKDREVISGIYRSPPIPDTVRTSRSVLRRSQYSDLTAPHSHPGFRMTPCMDSSFDINVREILTGFLLLLSAS
ncbi:pre-mRNA-splicing factor CWC22 homolog [Prorops nasuta]|uniref:pre-mRNA-splicing factor CWC22 homolog n=1 Tax=Prorops nasuta TaxID=863751 RepID=UPI0034CD33DC